MNSIIFIDFETSSTDPYTCYPLQLSAVAIHGKRLEIMEGGRFNEYMRPKLSDDEIMDPNIIQDGALTINHIKRESIKDFPIEKIVWENFCNWVTQFRGEGGVCIPAGWNYIRYDEIIINRLRDAYKTKRVFHENDFIDIMNFDWMFRESDPNYGGKSFLKAREHFGIQLSEGDKAHDARVDVEYGAKLLIRYMAWIKKVAKNKKYFAGALLDA